MVYDEYMKIRKKCRRFQEIEVISFCLYVVLKKEGVGRSSKQIAADTSISEKTLWKIESLLSHAPNPLDPSCLIEKNYKSFNVFTFQDSEAMKKLLKDLPYSDKSPVTKAAGIMFCYAKSKNKKITMSKLAREFKTCTQSIYRFYRMNYVTLCKD